MCVKSFSKMQVGGGFLNERGGGVKGGGGQEAELGVKNRHVSLRPIWGPLGSGGEGTAGVVAQEEVMVPTGSSLSHSASNNAPTADNAGRCKIGPASVSILAKSNRVGTIP